MVKAMPSPTSKHLSDRANAVVGPLILKPFVQTPLVKLILWITTGALPPVLRERLCLDWSRLDELRYRLHLKAVHEAIKAIPTQLQYFPLAKPTAPTSCTTTVDDGAAALETAQQIVGGRHRPSARVDDGWLVGFNKGEFGAALYWFSADGKQNYKISDHQVWEFFLWAFS